MQKTRAKNSHAWAPLRTNSESIPIGTINFFDCRLSFSALLELSQIKERREGGGARLDLGKAILLNWHITHALNLAFEKLEQTVSKYQHIN